MTERFEIFPQNVAKDGTLIIIQKGLKLYNISDVVVLLNELSEENKKLKQVNEMLQMDFTMTERNLIEGNEQLKRELDYIQNSITEHIKHQKTELGQKALKEVIKDYNEWLLGHKEGSG